MPRPKKTELSKAVNPGTKRGNPDFVSSSFYVPKKINLKFDRAILTLKASGYELDRSDILSTLMDRFATSVDAVERQGGEMDLESILATATEDVVSESAEVSSLKTVMRESIEAMKADYAEGMEKIRQTLEDAQKLREGGSSDQAG